MELLMDVVLDAAVDTLKLLPFLFLTYLAMEALEHHAGERSEEAVRKAGSLGPVVGAVLGVVPQCGFSAAASTLFAGRVITVGTLLAVFLSTSDEMLPILIAEQAPLSLIGQVLLIKVAVAIVVGFVVDALVRLAKRDGDGHIHIHELCEQEHCDCEDSVLVSAVKHTLQVTLFIFLVALVLGFVIEWVGPEALASFMSQNPALSVVAASLVGLIPNCAASVAITELYLEGALGFGAMMGGLLVSAGVGLLVLFRTNRPMGLNFAITGVLLAVGVAFGGLLTLVGLG
ncbi:MAG: putative manganese transporter [Eggerthellales bacterium]|nr:putative manganese transporter [Eggerthellales bacterium]